MDVNNIGEYSAHYFIKLFGTWNRFLESVGDVGNLTPDKLIDEYYAVKAKVGHQPTRKEMKMHSNCYSPAQYRRSWGSWNKFLESIGEVAIPDDSLLTAAYYDVKKILGHVPTQKEIDEYGQYNNINYRNVWGTWKKFLATIGEVELGEDYDEKRVKKNKNRK